MAQVAEIPPLVPISDAGARFLGGLSRSTIYGLVDAGELDRVTVGRRAFVTGASIQRFLDQLIARRQRDGDDSDSAPDSCSDDDQPDGARTVPVSGSATSRKPLLGPG